jgi:hypothetical protein
MNSNRTDGAVGVDDTTVPVKVLHKVQSEDPVLNRFQDQVLGVLNPFMKAASGAIGATPQADTASLPPPSATVAGKMYRVRDPGQPEVMKVCLADKNGVFSWQEVGAGSSRANAWANLGIWVGPSSPGAGITYAQWLAGASGYWGWKSIP